MVTPNYSSARRTSTLGIRYNLAVCSRRSKLFRFVRLLRLTEIGITKKFGRIEQKMALGDYAVFVIMDPNTYS